MHLCNAMKTIIYWWKRKKPMAHMRAWTHKMRIHWFRIFNKRDEKKKHWIKDEKKKKIHHDYDLPFGLWSIGNEISMIMDKTCTTSYRKRQKQPANWQTHTDTILTSLFHHNLRIFLAGVLVTYRICRTIIFLISFISLFACSKITCTLWLPYLLFVIYLLLVRLRTFFSSVLPMITFFLLIRAVFQIVI